MPLFTLLCTPLDPRHLLEAVGKQGRHPYLACEETWAQRGKATSPGHSNPAATGPDPSASWLRLNKGLWREALVLNLALP